MLRRAELHLSAFLFHFVGLQGFADGFAGGASVFEIETSVVLRAFDHFFNHETFRQVGASVGADAIGRVKDALVITVDGISLLSVIEAKDILVLKIV